MRALCKKKIRTLFLSATLKRLRCLFTPHPLCKPNVQHKNVSPITNYSLETRLTVVQDSSTIIISRYPFYQSSTSRMFFAKKTKAETPVCPHQGRQRARVLQLLYCIRAQQDIDHALLPGIGLGHHFQWNRVGWERWQQTLRINFNISNLNRTNCPTNIS